MIITPSERDCQAGIEASNRGRQPKAVYTNSPCCRWSNRPAIQDAQHTDEQAEYYVLTLSSIKLCACQSLHAWCPSMVSLCFFFFAFHLYPYVWIFRAILFNCMVTCVAKCCCCFSFMLLQQFFSVCVCMTVWLLGFLVFDMCAALTRVNHYDAMVLLQNKIQSIQYSVNYMRPIHPSKIHVHVAYNVCV